MRPALLPGTLCDAALWAGAALPADAVCLPPLRGQTLGDAAARVLSNVPGTGSFGTEPFHLVGFSLGAIVAFEVLRRAPERVGCLTLISANPLAPLPAQLEAWAGQERQVRAGEFAEVVAASAQAAGQHGDTVRAMAERVGPEVFLEQLGLLRSRPDSRLVLGRYQGPCRILVGSDDAVTPLKLSEEMAALMPQAQLQVVEGAGHFLPLDAPEVISQALSAEKEMHHV